MYLAFDNDLRAVVGAIEVHRLVVRFECEVLKSVMLICDEKGHVSLARALTPKGILQAFLIFNTVYRLPGVTYAELPNFMLQELLCLIKLNNEKRIQPTNTKDTWSGTDGVRYRSGTYTKWDTQSGICMECDTYGVRYKSGAHTELDTNGVGYTGNGIYTEWDTRSWIYMEWNTH